MQYFTFPSTIEAHEFPLQSVVQSLVDGLKVRVGKTDYLVGNLALNEGVSAHKVINSDPEDLDYQVVGQAGLLLVAKKVTGPISLTVGFPYTTYQEYAQKAAGHFRGSKEVQYETFRFGKAHQQKLSVHVEKIDTIPEILGCATFARHQQDLADDFFVASLGYGTFEAARVHAGGLVERSVVSTHGLRFAVNSAMREIQKQYYLDLRNEHQFDKFFQANSLIVKRKRVDLSTYRKQAIKRYFAEVIAPALRNRWKDDDFFNAETIVLVGGGALYPEAVDAFTGEFADVIRVLVPETPLLAAATGYTLWAQRNASNGNVPVGMDIGNAYTAIGIIEPDNEKAEDF